MGTFTISQTPNAVNVFFIPNAVGCNTGLSPYGAVNNYQCVDDPRDIPDDDASYVSNATPSLLYDLYHLPNSTQSGTINYVQIYARGKSYLTGQHVDGIYKIILTDNNCSNIYKSSDIDLITDYVTYNNIWTTNPRTDIAWTWTDIDNLQIGVECSSPSVASIFNSVFRPNANDVASCKQYPASGNNYDKVDENVADDADTYVYSDFNDGWLQDLYDIPNHNAASQSGTINSVTLWNRWQLYTYAPYSTTSRIDPIIETYGYEYEGIRRSITQSSATGWMTISDTWNSNPSTSLAWTWTEIDNLKIGAELYCYGWGAPPSETRNTQCYIIVNHTENISPEIRTTQLYTKVNYTPSPSECTLHKPIEIAVDEEQKIKMLNFWSGNRKVYGEYRSHKTMVINGIQYSDDACTIMDCVRDMAENGAEITTSGLGDLFDDNFRIISFGYDKISDLPLAFKWIMECEFA